MCVCVCLKLLVDEGGGSKYHYKRTIIATPVKHHLNGVSLACRSCSNFECCLAGFVIFQGIWTSIARKPYIFVIFQGATGPPVAAFKML